MLLDDKGGDVWTPFKVLHSQIELTLSHPDSEVVAQLETALRRHRPDFLALLRYPGKQTADRTELQRSLCEGMPLGPRIASQGLIEEAFLLSDMYNLSEYIALDLLKIAEQQQSNHPLEARGLVAVLLYYDGRKALVHSLLLLLQARQGLTWTLGLPSAVTDMCTSFTNHLFQEGLVQHILTLLEEMDLNTELEKLQIHLALGSVRHRREVLQLYQGISQHLADCLFAAAAQTGLSREDTQRLIEYLSRQKGITESDKIEKEDDFVAYKPFEGLGQPLDPITRTLLMALLCSIDLSVLQRKEDCDELVQNLPILADKEFISSIHRSLVTSDSSSATWQCPGLKAVAQLGWAVTLATLRSSPIPVACPDAGNLSDMDEAVVDIAVDQKVFFFIYNSLLTSPGFMNEEFHVRQLHQLICDLLVLLPLKVKELRNKADEVARTALMYSQEGLESPTHLPRHFEHLLMMMQRLYSTDPLQLGLVLDYWEVGDSTLATSVGHSAGLSVQSQFRQVALFKFVRLAGDLLPPSLYISYVHFLSSLASHPRAAQHAFHMLRANGSGMSSTMSWDHFFASMAKYLQNLKQEMPLTHDTVYRNRPHLKGITPQEIYGLLAVLRLVEIVIKHDETSRNLLSENLTWSPLSLLIGLVSCAVPLCLKAQLLYTLAAFALSPELATAVWQGLETAQLLVTIMPIGSGLSSTGSKPRDIQVELEEIESRAEVYPVTRAMLKLLNVLCRRPPPSALGSGRRTPGFYPYFTYVRDAVLLKCLTRSYSDRTEKWEIAALCLELFEKLLNQYDPESNKESVKGEFNQPPGYHIILHMMQDTPLFKLVLLCIEDGTAVVSHLGPNSSAKELERCTLAALHLIEITLRLQRPFVATQAENVSTPLLLGGLPALLLMINPRSGCSDYLITIARFMTFSWLPRHALSAATILGAVVATSPAADEQLLAMLATDSDTAAVFRHGIIEQLEADDGKDLTSLTDECDPSPLETEKNELSSSVQTKLVLLSLVQQCLTHPAPNIAHFLLGFNLRQPLYKTTLQQPGVLGTAKSVLHSVLLLLDAALCPRSAISISSGQNPVVSHILEPPPALAEKAASLLYSLCVNGHTCGPVLRYLRSVSALHNYLSALPLEKLDRKNDEGFCLGMVAWLMRCIAIEMKMTSSSQQLEKLLVTLIGHDSAENGIGWSATAPCKLLVMLEDLNFGSKDPVVPHWEYFDPLQVKKLLSDCHTVSDGNAETVDVDRVHRVLMEEIVALQNSTVVGQRQLMLDELKNILRLAVSINDHQQWDTARCQYMEAWHQLIEVVVLVTPPTTVSSEEKVRLVLALTQTLLQKVHGEKTNSRLASLASSAVLVLMDCLRRCNSNPAVLSHQSLPGASSHSANYIPFLDGPPIPTLRVATGSGHRPLISTHISTLEVILSGLLKWLLQAGGLPQQVRANLYSSLLTFLHLAREEVRVPDYFSSQQLGKGQQLQEVANETVLSFGEALMEIVCRDSLTGHDITKMLALSCLDIFFASKGATVWLQFLTGHGYLRHLVSSLSTEDDMLQNVLQQSPSTTSLRSLYHFTTKMAVLSRIALHSSGAQALLLHGITVRLAEMKVFAACAHADLRGGGGKDERNGSSSATCSVAQCSHDILLSVLWLCHALITGLGTENVSASTQVLQFIMNHHEALAVLLTRPVLPNDMPTLQEKTLLLGLLARTASLDVFFADVTDSSTLEQGGRLKSLVTEALALLPITDSLASSSSEKTLLDTTAAKAESNRDAENSQLLRMVAVVLLMMQKLSHCRTISGSRPTHLLLNFDIERSHDGSTEKVPGLGALVSQLRSSLHSLEKVREEQRGLQRYMTQLPSMATNEILQLVPASRRTDSLTPVEARAIAGFELTRLASLRMWEARIVKIALETALVLLWGHLDGTAVQDRKSLKHELARNLDDVLLQQLQDAAKNQEPLLPNSAPPPPFVEALLRRIRHFMGPSN